jgi:hypothetical protein
MLQIINNNKTAIKNYMANIEWSNKVLWCICKWMKETNSYVAGSCKKDLFKLQKQIELGK